MAYLRLGLGLLLAPREGWVAVSRLDPAAIRWRAGGLPLLLMLPWLALLAHGLLSGRPGLVAGDGVLQWPVPEGGVTYRQSLGGLGLAALVLPAHLTANLCGMAMLREAALRLAPRFGAVADHAAARKLAAFAPIPFWLGGALTCVPGLGQWPAVAGLGFALLLVALGAPRLLPPGLNRPAEERGRFGRAMAWRAVLAGGVAVLLAGVVMLATGVLVGIGMLALLWPFAQPAPGIAI